LCGLADQNSAAYDPPDTSQYAAIDLHIPPRASTPGIGNASGIEDTVLFFHIFGVMLFISGIVVAGIAFEAARRRQRAEEVALLLGLGRAAVPLVGLGALLLFACGLWLVGLEEELDYGTAWVSAAIAIFVVAMGLGGYGGQRPKQARMLASQLAERGDGVTAELRALLDNPVSRAANYASAALILVVLALMVFKP
jgi:hypothetical protein